MIMNKDRLNKHDIFLSILIILISIIGLLVIYSTTFSFTGDSSLSENTIKQIIFLIFGMMIYFLLSLVDLSWISNSGIIKVIYVVILTLQILVKFFGDTRAGTNRWIDIGFFSLQPAEYAKIAIILLTAKTLSDINLYESKPIFNKIIKKGRKSIKFLNVRPVLYMLLKNALMILPLIFLTLIQPSLGNALVSLALYLLIILILFPKPLLLIKFILIFFLGISIALHIFEVRFISPEFTINFHDPVNLINILLISIALIVVIIFFRITPKFFIPVILLGLILIIGIPYIWNNTITNYQKQRVLTYFEGPESDPLGAGYQVIQSRIAIGSGMLTGRGYLQGTQASLRVLTQAYTDFAFAAYAEQFGFLGSMLLLSLYLILLLRILSIARNSKDHFGKYLCLGVTILLFLHIFINIGMNLGNLPVTGIPLPLVSYGGSSTVMILILLGLVQSVQASKRSVDIADNLMLTSRSLLLKK